MTSNNSDVRILHTVFSFDCMYEDSRLRAKGGYPIVDCFFNLRRATHSVGYAKLLKVLTNRR